MKERGILFSGAMVRAVLAGTKSQTRRLVTPQPVRVLDHIEPVGTREDGSVINLRVPDGWQHPRLGYTADTSATKFGHGAQWDNPFGCVGDRLWVRETWGFSAKVTTDGHERWLAERDTSYLVYRANEAEQAARWRPSLHMPLWASRITLEITSVRVERLQDISEADAKAEGMPLGPGPGMLNGQPVTLAIFDPRLAFQVLWDSLNAKRAPWSSNPWVWVIEFKRIEAERKAVG